MKFKLLIRAANLVVYCILGCIAYGLTYEQLIYPRQFVFSTPISTTLKTLPPDKLSEAIHVFEIRLAQYHAVTGDIKTMLYSMVIIIGISIYTTLTQPKSFELPFIKVHADALWLRWTCPGILLYLWLHLGYTLYSSVVSRVFLIDLEYLIERSCEPLIAQQDSAKYAMEDIGIGDFIFYLFSPVYVSAREPVNTAFSWLILIGLYGTMLGVLHGTLMAGLVSWMAATKARILSIATFSVSCVIVAGSHAALFVKLPTLWIMQVYICIIGIVTFFWLPTTVSENETKLIIEV